MELNLAKFAEFDLSRRVSLLILVSILVIYLAITIAGEMWTEECVGLRDCFDFDRRMAWLSVWDYNWIKTDLRHSLHMTLLVISYQLFGNYKVLVLASSVLLLVVSYLLTTILSGKRLGGIIAVLVILQSSNFFKYDTSVTYPSFWALLFLTSVYLVFTKRSFLSPLPYLLSIPAKSLTALFMPGLLAFLWIEKKKKLFAFYVILTVVGIALVFSYEQFSEKELGGFMLITHFDPEKFLTGSVSWMWKGFASDQTTLMLLVVSGFLLFITRKKIPHSGSILALSGSMVLISPVLIGMTTYDVWPYRMLPLVIMTGVMVGMVISHLDKINLRMFSK